MGVKGLIAVDVTVHVIQSSTDHQERLPWRDFLLPSMLKPLLISIGLMVFQQFSGVNAVIFNAASIFSNAGFSDAKLISITVGAVQFIGAGLGCLLMDKAGRRKILLMTGLVMCICHVVLGVYFEIYIPPTEETPQADTLALLGSIHRSVPAKKNFLSVNHKPCRIQHVLRSRLGTSCMVNNVGNISSTSSRPGWWYCDVD